MKLRRCIPSRAIARAVEETGASRSYAIPVFIPIVLLLPTCHAIVRKNRRLRSIKLFLRNYLMMEDYSDLRLYPCFLLHDRKIPCCVWLEDAVKYHGTNTVLFNMHILVTNLDSAAQVLTEKGWSLVERDPSRWDIGVAAKPNRRLVPPQDIISRHNFDTSQPLPPPSQKLGPATTILLQAEDWNFTLPEENR